MEFGKPYEVTRIEPGSGTLTAVLSLQFSHIFLKNLRMCYKAEYPFIAFIKVKPEIKSCKGNFYGSQAVWAGTKWRESRL